MEAVAAFSLAGTILTFIDSGSRFVLLAHKLYKSSSDDAFDHQALQEITESLTVALSQLLDKGNMEPKDNSLAHLAKECHKTASDLLAILQKVSAKGSARKRDALQSAFRIVCKGDEIESLRNRLSEFRGQLNMHLLLSVRWAGSF